MSTKVIASALAAVAVLALGIFLFFGTPTNQIKSVVNQQFTAISVADFEKAHTYLAKDKRAAMDKDDLRYYVAQRPLLQYNVKRTFSSIVIQDATATAYMDVEAVDGQKGAINVFLVKEEGKWMISTYDFTPDIK